MTSKRISIGLLACVGCLVPGAQAHASHLEQVNLKRAFDADVIVNGTTARNADTSQTAMDFDGNALITKGAAKALKSCKDDPDGLPNDGEFARNADHPLVKLGYSNTRNGNNARQMEAGDTFEVEVPPGKYREIHVFATTGSGESDITVTEVYEGFKAVNPLSVWDWFDSQPDYGYALANGMDRARAVAKPCFDDDGATVWGYRIETDQQLPLSAVEITRTDDSGAFLNVFGITGVRSRAH